MERIGAGIRCMVHEMRTLDVPDPAFREQHEFLVIFCVESLQTVEKVGYTGHGGMLLAPTASFSTASAR